MFDMQLGVRWALVNANVMQGAVKLVASIVAQPLNSDTAPLQQAAMFALHNVMKDSAQASRAVVLDAMSWAHLRDILTGADHQLATRAWGMIRNWSHAGSGLQPNRQLKEWGATPELLQLAVQVSTGACLAPCR